MFELNHGFFHLAFVMSLNFPAEIPHLLKFLIYEID